MRKWLNDSPLWSTFLAKEQEVKVSLLILLIQKCSKVNQFLLTNSKFFLPSDFPLLCVTAALVTATLFQKKPKSQDHQAMLIPVKLKFFNCSLNRKQVQCVFFLCAENSRGETDEHLKKFLHYHFVEPNRSRENAVTNAQNSSFQTEVQSHKSGIIE